MSVKIFFGDLKSKSAECICKHQSFSPQPYKTGQYQWEDWSYFNAMVLSMEEKELWQDSTIVWLDAF